MLGILEFTCNKVLLGVVVTIRENDLFKAIARGLGMDLEWIGRFVDQNNGKKNSSGHQSVDNLRIQNQRQIEKAHLGTALEYPGY